MYVREKKIRRGIGTWDSPTRVYSYWELVRGDRVEGKVKQSVVAYLGPVGDDLPDKERAMEVAKAAGLVCGVVGCGRDATEELTWKGWRGTRTPVEFNSKRFGKAGAWVCERCLEKWQEGQLDSSAAKGMKVVPFYFRDGLPAIQRERK